MNKRQSCFWKCGMCNSLDQLSYHVSCSSPPMQVRSSALSKYHFFRCLWFLSRRLLRHNIAVPAIKLYTFPSCHMASVLAAAQSQQRPNIRDVLETFQQRHKVKQVVVCVVTDPALDGNGVVYKERVRISLC